MSNNTLQVVYLRKRSRIQEENEHIQEYFQDVSIRSVIQNALMYVKIQHANEFLLVFMIELKRNLFKAIDNNA